jgi:hypothetical protein
VPILPMLLGAFQPLKPENTGLLPVLLPRM